MEHLIRNFLNSITFFEEFGLGMSIDLFKPEPAFWLDQSACLLMKNMGKPCMGEKKKKGKEKWQIFW